jgi:hypothetical protein
MPAKAVEKEGGSERRVVLGAVLLLRPVWCGLFCRLDDQMISSKQQYQQLRAAKAVGNTQRRAIATQGRRSLSVSAAATF